MKYNDITVNKLRELPIFDVCSHLGISLYGMGQLTRRTTCWYHDDQHPSMHINKQKNIFKCFVCGKGGDVIRLVQDYRNLTFPEACEWLINEFSVVIVTPSHTHQSSSLKHQTSTVSPSPLTINYESKDPSTLSLHTSSFRSIPSTLISRSQSIDSEFCQSLVACAYLSDNQMRHAAQRYRLGATKDRAVIFWEIDQQDHCHNGKMMHYLPDCHRDKTRTPTWAASELKKSGSLPPQFDNPHCLFGLHLLYERRMMSDGERRMMSDGRGETTNSQSPTTIAIVESEKSAVILSEYFPDCLWLSCGGLQMLKPQLLEPLIHHKIILFPDTDTNGDAFAIWTNVAHQAATTYSFHYPIRISPILEQRASEEQKRRKIDLVDLLFEGKREEGRGMKAEG